MKKLLLLTFLLILGIKINAQQTLFVSGTNKSMDGYITVGFLKNNWGLYAGAPYNDQDVVNTKTGTISSRAKFGILHLLPNHNWLLGVGIQPTNEGNKANAFLAYAPLKSNDIKLWMIGNLTGNNFTPGLGLTYKLK